MNEEIYGIFGTGKVVRDNEGCIEMWATVSESGLYAGAPPEEFRIEQLFSKNTYDKKGLEQAISETNKKRDLPLYLRSVKVKIIGD